MPVFAKIKSKTMEGNELCVAETAPEMSRKRPQQKLAWKATKTKVDR